MNIKPIIQDPIQTNCYIITDNTSTIIVDPGDVNKAEKIKQHIKGELVAIVLTHAHFDHSLAAHCFNVPTYMHKDEITQLPFHQALTKQFMHQELILPKEIKQLKNKTNLGTISFEVIHTPGHTNGSVCLLFEDVLISGDTLFKGAHGRTDLGGNDEQIIISLKKLITLNPKLKVYPGHGPTTTIEQEKNWIERLHQT